MRQPSVGVGVHLRRAGWPGMDLPIAMNKILSMEPRKVVELFGRMAKCLQLAVILPQQLAAVLVCCRCCRLEIPLLLPSRAAS